MKVSDTSNVAQARAAQGAEPVASEIAKGAAEPAKKASVSDKVSLAHASVVEEAAKVASSSRMERLKQVEAAVRQGSYRPDAGRIAQQIIDDAEVTARVRAALGG